MRPQGVEVHGAVAGALVGMIVGAALVWVFSAARAVGAVVTFDHAAAAVAAPTVIGALVGMFLDGGGEP